MHRSNAPRRLAVGALAAAFALAVAVAGPWPDDAYVLRIDGLACPYCGYGIEKRFARHGAVATVEIDVERGVVIVTTEPGAGLSNAELRGIVHDAGFAMGEIVRRPAAD